MNSQYDRKVTYIDELPELDDLGSYSDNQMNNGTGFSMIPNDVAEKYQKVIRSNHVPSAESGMFYHNNMNMQNMQNMQNIQNVQTRVIPSKVNMSVMSYSPQSQLKYENYTPVDNIQENYTSNISCLDFAKHVKNCPICSKFYNTDKTPYIISIVILSIVCILLLRKVLNM